MNPVIALIILGVLLLGLLSWFMSKRLRTVPEGYVAVIQWMDKHARIVDSGPYLLSPGEKTGVELLVRQREVPLQVPGIFTHGGLPLAVHLLFSMRVDAHAMPIDELYYSDAERNSQQVKIFKDILQQLIATTERPTPSADPNRVDTSSLFSPLSGAQFAQLRDTLQSQVQDAFRPHGLIVTDEPIVIMRLDIPLEIVDGYMGLVKSGFDSSAQHEFIRRIRAAAPNISDSNLTQLLHVTKNPNADMRAIFTSGSIQPQMLMADKDIVLNQSTAEDPSVGDKAPIAEEDERQAASDSDQEEEIDLNERLSDEDMAMLRSLDF